MSGFQHKKGSGNLFRNDRKDKDTHPDWRGEILLDGILYEVAAWEKGSKRGPMLSLSGKPKRTEERRPARQEPDDPRTAFKRDMDDEVPF